MGRATLTAPGNGPRRARDIRGPGRGRRGPRVFEEAGGTNDLVPLFSAGHPPSETIDTSLLDVCTARGTGALEATHAIGGGPHPPMGDPRVRSPTRSVAQRSGEGRRGPARRSIGCPD